MRNSIYYRLKPLLPQSVRLSLRRWHAQHQLKKGKRAAVLLYSYYPFDPRPRRAAEALADAGMEVDLLCLREHDSEPTQERINGVNVHRRPLRKKRSRKLDYLWQYGRFILSSFFFVTRRGLLTKYDLVHVHNMPDVLVFAALAAKLRGAQVILDLHDPMPELMTSIYGLPPKHRLVRLIRMLERWSIGFADHVITPNIAFKDLFVSRSCRPDKIEIVMNSPNEDVFDPNHFGCNGLSFPSSNEFRIMHHGSIVERHGIDLLVEAVARVSLQIPTVRLDIYGSRTPFLDDVMKTAERLGISRIVHYHGPKSQPEIAEAIWNCQLGVVPNRRSPFTELNFPTRLFEYLSIHRPVVAPSTKGIRDYFGPEDLVMFEADNVEDLANKILWVWSHPKNVSEIVERGHQVYAQNLWSKERARFLQQVTGLVAARA